MCVYALQECKSKLKMIFPSLLFSLSLSHVCLCLFLLFCTFLIECERRLCVDRKVSLFSQFYRISFQPRKFAALFTLVFHIGNRRCQQQPHSLSLISPSSYEIFTYFFLCRRNRYTFFSPFDSFASRSPSKCVPFLCTHICRSRTHLYVFVCS